MNKKGQIGVGLIVIVAITLVVGIIFFTTISQEVGKSTNTHEVANYSMTVAVNGTAQYLPYRSLASVVIINETNGTAGDTDQGPVLAAGNYTVATNVINPTTGELSVSITPTASAAVKSIWRVSGTAQPTTYIGNSGARAMAGLIGIFFALALAIVALSPVLREELLNLIGK